MQKPPEPHKVAFSSVGDSTTIEMPPAGPPTGVSAQRYVRKEFHARGGMGEIWVSHDVRLGREVALKTLHDTCERARERFLTEAQVTGQLEHPGVVPLHDLGVNDTGHPFYVMKLVRGRTLKNAIAEFYSDSSSDVPREVQRLRLLKIFLDLCQVVAYAHSRGVLHRDLKPDNVMLGEYGETVLLDWGLAKVRGPPETIGGSSPNQLSGSISATHTEAGSIMGSLLYMPPEMAEGRTTDTNERTDVYSLGATLYEMLTGRTPREGRSRDEILDLARTAAPTAPRRIRPDIARPLEAICLKAMARRPEDRYPSASALADDLQRFLAGEPVSVYRESPLARAWRWSKRHRAALVRTAAAMAIIAAATSAVLAFRQTAQLRQREDARIQVAQFDAAGDEARFYAANTNPLGEHAPYYDPQKARKAAQVALTVAAIWGPGFDRLPQPEERPRLRTSACELLLLLAQDTAARQPYDTQASELGALLDQAQSLSASLSPGYHRLRAEFFRLQQKTADENHEQILAADPATPMTAFDWFLLGEKRRTALGSARAAELGLQSRDSKQADGVQAAMDAYRAAIQIDPRDYWSHFQLGRCFMSLGQLGQAVEALGACIALRPDAPWAYSARGLAQGLLRHFDQANADLNHALELNPQFRPAFLNRGVVHRLENKPADAIADFAAALAPPDDRALAEAAYYRAQMYMNSGQFDKARQDVDFLIINRGNFAPGYVLRARLYLLRDEPAAALESLNTLLALGPRHAPPDSAEMLAQRGRMLRVLASELPNAAARGALELACRDLEAALASASPTAAAYGDLGAAREAQGNADAAIRAYDRALALQPQDVGIRIDRAWDLQKLNRLSEARADFQEVVTHHDADAQAHAGLGFVQACQGNYDDARQEAAQAMMYGANDYLILHNVACIFAQIAQTSAAGRTNSQDAAITILRRAVDLWRASDAGPDELVLIRCERAFDALRARSEFRQLGETGG